MPAEVCLHKPTGAWSEPGHKASHQTMIERLSRLGGRGDGSSRRSAAKGGSQRGSSSRRGRRRTRDGSQTAGSAGSLRGALSSLTRARSSSAGTAGRRKAAAADGGQSKTSKLLASLSREASEYCFSLAVDDNKQRAQRSSSNANCRGNSRVRQRARSVDAAWSSLHNEMTSMLHHRENESKSSQREVDALLSQLGVAPPGSLVANICKEASSRPSRSRRRSRGRRSKSVCAAAVRRDANNRCVAAVRKDANNRKSVFAEEKAKSRPELTSEGSARSLEDISRAYRPCRSRSRSIGARGANNECGMSQSHDDVLISSTKTRPGRRKPERDRHSLAESESDEATAPMSNASRHSGGYYKARLQLSSGSKARPMAKSCNDATPKPPPMSSRPKGLTRSCDEVYPHCGNDVNADDAAGPEFNRLSINSSGATAGDYYDHGIEDDTVKGELKRDPSSAFVPVKRASHGDGGHVESAAHTCESVKTMPLNQATLTMEQACEEVNRRVAEALQAAGVDPSDPDVARRLAEDPPFAQRRGSEDQHLSETEITDRTAATTITASSIDERRDHQSLPSTSNSAPKKYGKMRRKKSTGTSETKESSLMGSTKLLRKCSAGATSLRSVPERDSLHLQDGQTEAKGLKPQLGQRESPPLPPETTVAGPGGSVPSAIDVSPEGAVPAAIDVSRPECPMSPFDSVVGSRKEPAPLTTMMWPPPPPPPPPAMEQEAPPKRPPAAPRRPSAGSSVTASRGSGLERPGSVDESSRRRGGRTRKKKKKPSVHRETKF